MRVNPCRAELLRDDLADYLSEYHTHHMFAMPRRVAGEPAHDRLQHVVGLLGGEMLTRRLPIPPAEAGVVYQSGSIWASSSRSW